MKRYLALLRGINVGGKNMIKMTDLKEALAAAGLSDIVTYIQSGNVFFSSNETNTDKLALQVKACIEKTFQLAVDVAVFSKAEWQQVVDAAPSWWGKDPGWKHNLIIMIKPFNMDDAVADIGELKPDIEAIMPGKGVIYQGISLKMFGRASSGKLASMPVYKQMTIRNYNTATKLLGLFD